MPILSGVSFWDVTKNHVSSHSTQAEQPANMSAYRHTHAKCDSVCVCGWGGWMGGVHAHTWASVCNYMCVHACVCVCSCARTHVCACTHECVYVCIHVWNGKPQCSTSSLQTSTYIHVIGKGFWYGPGLSIEAEELVLVLQWLDAVAHIQEGPSRWLHAMKLDSVQQSHNSGKLSYWWYIYYI